ncbi:MAG: trigger factor [candidate division WOR-3 bacterium]
MEYQIVNDGETEKEIEFKIGAQELNPYIEESLEKLRTKVSIKGYRKGRAPKGLIRTRYYDTLKAEAINDLILDSYKKVLQEKNWEPVSNPELLKFDDSTEIKFSLRLEILPRFEVENYKGLELLKEEPLPVEYLYEQTINRLRENYASVVETDRPAAVDDFVTMDLEISEDNKIVDNQTDIVIKVGDRSFPDELNRALVGVKKGQKKEVQVDKQLYRFKVKKIEERILPQVDIEFARMLNFGNLEEMEKGIKEMLQKEEEERLADELRENLARVMLERFQFAVPKAISEKEYQFMLKTHNLTDNDSTRERFLPVAEKRARFNLILDKIGQKENITAVDEEVAKLAQRNALEMENIDEEVKDYLRKIVVREEVVKFLLTHANIVQKGKILSPEEAKNANRAVRH